MAGWEKAVIALLVLVGAGGWTVMHRGVTERQEAGATLAQTRLKEIERLNAERARLAAGPSFSPTIVNPSEAGPSASATPAMAAVSGAVPGLSGPARSEAVVRLADLLEKGILAAMPATTLALGRPAGTGPAGPAYAINAQGRLALGFGELFGLSQDQLDRLQEKVTALKQQVETSALAGTTVQQTGENSYTLTMQPLAAATQARDEFVAAFREALGEDNYRLFAALNGERVSAEGVRTGGPANLLAQIGGEARTMTVTRTAAGFQYTFKGGDSSGSGNGADLANLSARLGPGVNLLPSAFLNAPFPNRVGGGGAGGAGGGRGGETVIQLERSGEAGTTTLRTVMPAAGDTLQSK
jgi:hypothetical protein